MNTSDQLIRQIRELNDGDLLEAVIYYFSEKFNISSRDEIQHALSSFCEAHQVSFAELMSINSRLEEDRESYRTLLRFLLISESQLGDAELQRVQAAVDSVGQKQVISELGLAIILGTLATLVLSGYAITITDGVTKTSSVKTYEIKADGTVFITETKETRRIDPLSPLGSLFNFFAGIGKK